MSNQEPEKVYQTIEKPGHNKNIEIHNHENLDSCINKIASWLYNLDEDLKNEKIKLLDSTENISGNLFYNSAVKKYYFISDLYNGEVTELTGIKNVSGILLDSYIIGE